MTRSLLSLIAGRVGAICYIAWGAFHVRVAHDIYVLGAAQTGIAQGRLFQLAAYILTIALFAVIVGALGNWRNNPTAYWLNLCVVGWADGIWALVVVLPGYVPVLRGLTPPAIFVLAAALTTIARRRNRSVRPPGGPRS
jgi:hypothetical protein